MRFRKQEKGWFLVMLLLKQFKALYLVIPVVFSAVVGEVDDLIRKKIRRESGQISILSTHFKNKC